MKLFISILIPLALGAIAGYFTSTGVDGWYAAANKPSFNPPNGIFAPVWTVLYVMMGIACWLIWKAEANEQLKRKALWAYAIQLALNFAWSFIFFVLLETGWALVEIGMLWLAILITIAVFARVNRAAAWLMVPYACWVTFATLLNYSIWRLNA